jgi:hypothetical protein
LPTQSGNGADGGGEGFDIESLKPKAPSRGLHDATIPKGIESNSSWNKLPAAWEKTWRFYQSIERPDFVVSEAGHRFGLEVMGVFMGAHQ